MEYLLAQSRNEVNLRQLRGKFDKITVLDGQSTLMIVNLLCFSLTANRLYHITYPFPAISPNFKNLTTQNLGNDEIVLYQTFS